MPIIITRLSCESEYDEVGSRKNVPRSVVQVSSMGANRFYEWRPDVPWSVVQVSSTGANRFYEWRPDGTGSVVQASSTGANRFYEWRPDGPGSVVQTSMMGANGFYKWRPDRPGSVVQVSTMGANEFQATVWKQLKIPLQVVRRVELIVFWWTERGANGGNFGVQSATNSMLVPYLPKYKLYVDTLQEHQWNC